MRSQEIARRYAAALYQVSVEDTAVKQIEVELASIAASASDEPEVRRFLAHPLVPRGTKLEFMAAAFPDTSENLRSPSSTRASGGAPFCCGRASQRLMMTITNRQLTWHWY